MNTLTQAYQSVDALGFDYALLQGEFSSIGEGDNPDIDVLFFEVSKADLIAKMQTEGLVLNGRQCVLYTTVYEAIRVDYYIDWVNCGYYRLFPVSKEDNIEAIYMAYQIVEPLIKFGKYLPRHKSRLFAYLNKYGSFSEETLTKVSLAFGALMTKKLISKLMSQDYLVSSRKMKNAALMRNGNMKRMLVERLG